MMKKAVSKNNNVTKRKFAASDAAYIGVFTAIIAVCSWISIPAPIPFTLQTMGVCICAGILGAKKGALCVIVYILLGVIGIPVFSGFSSGIGQLLGPTGGYIIGFIFTALIIGGFSHLFGKKGIVLFLSMVLGIAVCYVFGTAWYMIVYNKSSEANVSLSGALGICVVPFIIPDMAKAAAAAFICLSLKKYTKKFKKQL